MKKIIISTIILFNFSCQDFLNRESQELITINNQLKDKKGILEALHGAYYRLNNDIFFSEAFFTYADLLSGNLVFPPSTSNNNIQPPTNTAQIYNFSDIAEESNLKYFYQNSYQTINNINLIIKYIDEVKDASENEKKQIKAEALTLRAFIHFQLHKIYAQNYTFTNDSSHLSIVYNDKVLEVGKDYPSRKTTQETFDLLEKDLLQALSLFTDNQSINKGEKYNFFSKISTKTLLLDLYLWKNHWQKVIDLSNEIISESGLYLYDNTSNLQNWAQNEIIFQLPNSHNNTSLTSTHYTFGSSRPKYSLSNDLIDSFENSDFRKNLWEKRTISGNSYYFSTKFKHNIGNLIYRLSEIYFMRAEAYLKLNQKSLAIQDLNKIRNRAGLSDISDIDLNLLLQEKRKEFFTENKYFFDLIRNHQNIVRNHCYSNHSCNMPYPNDKFIAPIPQEAINENSNLKQNKGY